MVKNFMQFIVVLVGILFLSQAVAADKVVVIPLSSSKKLMNVVTVSAKGGDFTDPVAAVNSINNASASNPYLVFIGPGNYSLTQTLFMKSFVTIAGAGQDATTLIGAISSSAATEISAIISGADNSTLRDLTVENTGGSDYSIALYNNGTSPVIQDVTAIASGATSNLGVLNISCSSVMTDVTATGSGGTTNRGVANANGSSPIMTDVTATASGGTSSYGLRSHTSSPIIRHCTLDGTTGSIYVTAGTTRVIRSSIINGVNVESGTLTCVNSDNGVDNELDIDCTVILPPSP